ncbi:cysteine proteinase [Sistotremastrum niveocremeum HHB9708]|uniref:Ubiquitin carboxyl-terminal hydrolase n=1 Tax=Sistotremastrum niveocremeum HHB9708 TaxID=1314777 RepID=A0A164YSY9_9AGAM|nr:cysteine proteinase [Sistotremastrum niveocremeum HHB9708]
MGRDKKPISSQELYKQRKLKEQLEQNALLPPGLVNHGNTCFMNSVLQGLIATPRLEAIMNGDLPESSKSPALTNGRGGPNEHEWTQGLALSDVFVTLMEKAWRIRDAKQRSNMSPKELLTRLGAKYDQYLDFRQQDAHELLIHLLDGMRMEEFDIIKQRQPPPPKVKKSRSRSVEPTPSVPEIPPEEKLVSFVDSTFGGQLASFIVCEQCKHISITYEPFDDLSLSIKNDESKERRRDRLRAFTQKFRLSAAPRPQSVPPGAVRRPSHDEPEDYSRRKSIDHSPDPLRKRATPPSISKVGLPGGSSYEKLLVEEESLGSKLGRRVSSGFNFRRTRVKETEKPKDNGHSAEVHKRDFAHSTSSSSLATDASAALPPKRIDSLPAIIPKQPPRGKEGPPSRPTTPSQLLQARHKSKVSHSRTRSQTAYLNRILDQPNSSNPFSLLPPGSGMWTKFSPTQGLDECLRQFTAVEALDGENMFGCRKCWKMAHDPDYIQAHASGDRDDEDDDDEDDEPPSTARPHDLPTESKASPASTTIIASGGEINVSSLDLSASASSLPIALDRKGLIPVTTSVQYSGPPIPSITTEPPRSPSPASSLGSNDVRSPPSVHWSARPGLEHTQSQSQDSLVIPRHRATYHPNRHVHIIPGSDNESNSAGSSDESSDGALTDTSVTSASTSQPSITAPAPNGTHENSKRPIPRSKQVIMRRAFKRYLIAKPPPVLIIHLKRFQQVSRTPVALFGSFKKLDDYVPFPEKLDLAPYMAPRREDFVGRRAPGKDKNEAVLYRLYAVVVHIGNMLGGHYVAYTALPNPTKSIAHDANQATAPILPSTPGLERAATDSGLSTPTIESLKSPESKSKKDDRMWCYISDTVVRLSSIEEVLKAKAYMCMYERI